MGRLSRRLAYLVALVVLVAACSSSTTGDSEGGGPADSASASTSEAVVSSTEAPGTTTPETTASSAEPTTGSTADTDAMTSGADECILAAQAFSTVVGQQVDLLTSAVTGSLDEKALSALQDDIDTLVANSPEEIADDVATFSQAFQDFLTEAGPLMEDGGLLNPANAAKIEAAASVMESPEVKQAEQNIENYFDAECPS